MMHHPALSLEDLKRELKAKVIWFEEAYWDYWEDLKRELKDMRRGLILSVVVLMAEDLKRELKVSFSCGKGALPAVGGSQKRIEGKSLGVFGVGVFFLHGRISKEN